jgi:hypothetical protein
VLFDICFSFEFVLQGSGILDQELTSSSAVRLAAELAAQQIMERRSAPAQLA